LKNHRSFIYIIKDFSEAIRKFSSRYNIKWIIFVDKPGNQSSISYLIYSEYEDVGLSIIESRILNSSNVISVYRVTPNGLEKVLQIHSKPERYPCTYCYFYNNHYCKLHGVSNPEKVRNDCKCFISYNSNLRYSKLEKLLEKHEELCRGTYKIGSY